jgi:hypothetical protein
MDLTKQVEALVQAYMEGKVDWLEAHKVLITQQPHTTRQLTRHFYMMRLE